MASNNNNSNLINIPSGPSLPEIGYYNATLPLPQDTNNKQPNNNNYELLMNNVNNTCSTTKNGEFFKASLYNNPSDPLISPYLPNTKINPLDIPYYLGKQGMLMNPAYSKNLIKVSEAEPLKIKLISQIQYLVCQLISARNRFYNLDDFPLVTDRTSVKSTFSKFGKKLRSVMVMLFIVTMYFLISGFLSSFDVVANIMNLIQKNSDYSYTYWIGILIGILIPVIIISLTYNYQIKQNIKELEKSEITNNPYGIQNTIPTKNIKMDYLTLILYILLIYSFVAVLFTIKKKSFNNIIYTVLIGGIFIIITVLIFVMYAYIPFFNTTDTQKIMQIGPQPLRLFVDIPSNPQLEDTSKILTNQHTDSSLRKVYLLTVMSAFILTIVYLKVKNTYSILKGFLGSSAILIIPMLWVINFFIGIKYFFAYPIILLFIRFFRYIIMLILYITTKDKSKGNFSEDLINKLENFKDYSPSWGLLGIDELKLLLNIFGYENIFSKSLIGDDDSSSNISNNKFVSSGLINLYIGNKQIFIGIFNAIITFILSMIILFAYVKIQT